MVSCDAKISAPKTIMNSLPLSLIKLFFSTATFLQVLSKRNGSTKHGLATSPSLVFGTEYGITPLSQPSSQPAPRSEEGAAVKDYGRHEDEETLLVRGSSEMIFPLNSLPPFWLWGTF